MCTIECARCEATFTVSEELCGECDEALDVVWAERLGANLVAAGLAAMLTQQGECACGLAHRREMNYFAVQQVAIW